MFFKVKHGKHYYYGGKPKCSSSEPELGTGYDSWRNPRTIRAVVELEVDQEPESKRSHKKSSTTDITEHARRAEAGTRAQEKEGEANNQIRSVQSTSCQRTATQSEAADTSRSLTEVGLPVTPREQVPRDNENAWRGAPRSTKRVELRAEQHNVGNGPNPMATSTTVSISQSARARALTTTQHTGLNRGHPSIMRMNRQTCPAI